MKANVRLKKYLQEKGISQTFIAVKTGINVKTLNAIINGHTALKADLLIEICEKGLNISIEKFFAHKFQ